MKKYSTRDGLSAISPTSLFPEGEISIGRKVTYSNTATAKHPAWMEKILDRAYDVLQRAERVRS